MNEPNELPLCQWCGQPVMPEVCIILKTNDDQDLFLHWECVGKAGKAVVEAAKRKAVERN